MAEHQATGAQAVVRDISDTARWAAVFRARATERPDAIFRDPYAERLAGQMFLWLEKVTQRIEDGRSSFL